MQFDQDLNHMMSDPSSAINLEDFPLTQTVYAANHRRLFTGNSSSDIAHRMAALNKDDDRSQKSPNKTFNKVRQRTFQCKHCAFTCPSATNLSIHMRVHTGEKPYTCGTCTYASARKQNLFRHIATVHRCDPPIGGSSLPPSYPMSAQSAQDRMPGVDKMFGNAQDVVYVDVDQSKSMGRDEMNYASAADLESIPVISQVYTCESASSSASSQQADCVEVPPTNPTPTTDYGARHYADGNRFIFASGVTPSVDPTVNTSTTTPANLVERNFVSTVSSEVQDVEILNTESTQILDKSHSVNKPQGRIQSSTYKEPITGALKRKQGKASSLSAMTTILDNALMRSKNTTDHSLMASVKSSGISHLDNVTSGFKIIQSEKDLEEVLEGRQQTGLRIATMPQKKPDLKSSRGLSVDTSRKPGTFSYAGETEDVVYIRPSYPNAGRPPEKVPRAAESIATTKTSVFRLSHFPSTRSSSIRLPKTRNVQHAPTSEAIHANKQTTRREVPSINERSNSSQHAESQRQPTSHYADVTDRIEPHGDPGDKSGQDLHKGSRRSHLPHNSYGRGPLMIQVDLNKLMCCAARKWMQAHLNECDVCEINLPVPDARSFPLASGRSGGETEHITGRNKVEYEKPLQQAEQECYQDRNHGQESLGDRIGCRQSDAGWMSENSWRQASGLNLQEEQSVDFDDRDYHSAVRSYVSGRRVKDNSRGNEDISRSASVSPSMGHSAQFIRDGLDIHVQNTKRKKRNSGVHRRSHSPSAHNFSAETSVVGSTEIPISTPYVQEQQMPRVPKKQQEQSSELIAFLKAELKQSSAASRRPFHTKQRCFCDICGKACRSRVQLRSHRRVHMETRQPFRCTMCRFSSQQLKLLEGHIAETHPPSNSVEDEEEEDAATNLEAIHNVSMAEVGGDVSSEEEGSCALSRQAEPSGLVDDQPQEEQSCNMSDAAAMEMDALSSTSQDPTDEPAYKQEDEEQSTPAVVMAIKQEPEVN